MGCLDPFSGPGKRKLKSGKKSDFSGNLWEVSLSGTFTLALLAHLDKDLKDLLHIDGIYILLNCRVKRSFQDLASSFPIMDRQALVCLHLGYFSCNLLSLGDEIDYLEVDPVDLRPQGIYRHSIY